MLIKPNDGTVSATPASIRPAATPPLLPAAPPVTDNVSISSALRTFALALTELLPDGDAALIAEVLLPEDRLMLAAAFDWSRAQGGDPHDVGKLSLDLYAYRLRALGPQPPRAQSPVSLRDDAQRLELQLPTFPAREEALARAILASSALRDTLVDAGFVRTLLDPDQASPRTVDFAFLRRVVIALATTRPNVSAARVFGFERRSARVSLAEAVAALGLSKSELAGLPTDSARSSAAALRQRLDRVAAQPPLPSPSPALDSCEQATRLEPTETESLPGLARFTPTDRRVLVLVYTAAESRGIDLVAVDQVARCLLALRHAEQLELRAAHEPHAPHASAAPKSPAADTSQSASAALAPDPQPASSSLRSYGSASQLAAKVAGTYRSVAPPAPAARELSMDLQSAAMAVGAGAAPPERPGHERTVGPGMPTLTRSFDLALALGVSELVRAARMRARRALRMRMPSASEQGVRPIVAAREPASEAQADDPEADAAQRKRRVRWLLLVRRRRRARMQGR